MTDMETNRTSRDLVRGPTRSDSFRAHSFEILLATPIVGVLGFLATQVYQIHAVLEGTRVKASDQETKIKNLEDWRDHQKERAPTDPSPDDVALAGDLKKEQVESSELRRRVGTLEHQLVGQLGARAHSCVPTVLQRTDTPERLQRVLVVHPIGDGNDEIGAAELVLHIKEIVARTTAPGDPEVKVRLDQSSAVWELGAGLLYNVFDVSDADRTLVRRWLAGAPEIFDSRGMWTAVCVFSGDTAPACDRAGIVHGFDQNRILEREGLFSTPRGEIHLWVGAHLTHESGGTLRELRAEGPVAISAR